MSHEIPYLGRRQQKLTDNFEKAENWMPIKLTKIETLNQLLHVDSEAKSLLGAKKRQKNESKQVEIISLHLNLKGN